MIPALWKKKKAKQQISVPDNKFQEDNICTATQKYESYWYAWMHLCLVTFFTSWKEEKLKDSNKTWRWWWISILQLIQHYLSHIKTMKGW